MKWFLQKQKTLIEDQKKQKKISFLLDSAEDYEEQSNNLENKMKIEEILEKYLNHIIQSKSSSMTSGKFN